MENSTELLLEQQGTNMTLSGLVADSGPACVCCFASGLKPEQVVRVQGFPAHQRGVLGASVDSVSAMTLSQN